MPKSVLRAGLGRMQFTLHAARRTRHGASYLVQAMPAWLVKTRRALSRHSRDASVYGHTTTAMHKLSTPPPLSTSRTPSENTWEIRSYVTWARGFAGKIETQTRTHFCVVRARRFVNYDGAKKARTPFRPRGSESLFPARPPPNLRKKNKPRNGRVFLGNNSSS